MEFFVGIENKTYYHWQIELLLESFIQNNLQDKLLIASVTSENQINKKYTRNLENHKRIYQISKINYDIIYPKFAILKALGNSLNYKLISQPCTYLESSSVILKPDEIKIANESNIVVVKDPIYEKIFFDIVISDWFKFEDKNKTSFNEFFPAIGCAIILNKIPKSFFIRLVSVCKMLIEYQLLKSNYVHALTDKLAWAITISEYTNKLKVQEKELAAFLHTNEENVFLDYHHGIPPFFHKSMYKFDPPRYFSFGDPYQTLMNCQMSMNTKTLAALAEKSLEMAID
jgi:hypothetical protein